MNKIKKVNKVCPKTNAIHFTNKDYFEINKTIKSSN